MEQILKAYKQTFSPWINAQLYNPRPRGIIFRGCLTEILVRDDKEHVLIEQIIFPKGHDLPPHRHPNVSGLEFGIAGCGRYYRGRHLFDNDETDPKKLPLYIPRGTVHGGVTGYKGATIISVQYWYIWPPKESIFQDWERA